MIKHNQKTLLLFTSVILGILEIMLFVNIFPQTGLARVLYIPFYIIVCLLISMRLIKKKHTLKKTIIILIVFHLIFFHFILWSWPQSATIQKNLVNEFYKNIL